MKIIKCILLFLFLNTYANAKIDLLEKSHIYVDNTSSLNLKEVKNKTFIRNTKPMLNYGINKEKTVWVKFILDNLTKKDKEYILEYASSITKEITLYDKEHIYKDGLKNINKTRTSLRPIFILKLKPKSKNIYYLKVKSNNSSLMIKLNLWKKNDFYKQSNKQQTFINLFFGALIILLVYNLFIFIFTRDKSYLYYVAYIFFITLHSSIYLGYSSLYIFNQDSIKFIVNNQFILIFLIILFISLFTNSLLELNRFNKYYKLIKNYLIVLSIFAIFSFNSIIINANFSILFLPLIILLIYKANYLLFRKKEFLSFIYLIAWFPVLVLSFGWIYAGITNTTVKSIYEVFNYLLMFTILFEAIIFSIALAYRINSLQKNKELADKKLLEEQKNIEKILKEEVDKKTEDLTNALEEKELLLKELHHRIKNNLQMISSLLRLQNITVDDKKAKEVLQSAQNRIKAIGFLHELLYKQDNISYINTNDYFKLLVNELLKTSNKKINVTYKILYDIPLKDIIYCGLLINELISNCLKHAFNKEGKINISLDKKDSFYILVIKDNGKGLQEKKKNTLGLSLIDTLVKKQLKGDIDMINDEGLKVQIRWKDYG